MESENILSGNESEGGAVDVVGVGSLPEFGETLIEEVKKNDFVYDVRRPLHANRDALQQAWRKISLSVSKTLKTPVSEQTCKKEWVKLKKSYFQVKRHMKKPTGSARGRSTSWPYLDSMRFLDKCPNTRKKTTSNLTLRSELVETPLEGRGRRTPLAELENSDDGSDEELLLDDDGAVTPTPTSTPSSSRCSSRSSSKAPSTQDTMLEAVTNLIQQRVASGPRDELDGFVDAWKVMLRNVKNENPKQALQLCSTITRILNLPSAKLIPINTLLNQLA